MVAFMGYKTTRSPPMRSVLLVNAAYTIVTPGLLRRAVVCKLCYSASDSASIPEERRARSNGGGGARRKRNGCVWCVPWSCEDLFK